MSQEDRVGVVNPYAVVELALGRQVRWSAVKDRDAFVQKVLGVSMERLLTPGTGNLLFSGEAGMAEALPELRAEFDRFQVRAQELPPKATAADIAGPAASMFGHLSVSALTRVQGALLGAHGKDGGEYTPPGAEWGDPGDFFDEAAELHDPVQGALGDCYFIAALSAVAWARPYVIAQRTRATAHANADFFDRVDFHSGGAVVSVEVTENVPLVAGTRGWYYARSSEAGEIWPAVYEKAFAKWKTNGSSDRPDFAPIAGGWPVRSCEELTGLAGTTRTTSDHSADDIWSMVRSNSLSYRTFNPMVAWTYCRKDPPVTYAGSGLVGYHAYTVLGWAYVGGEKQIVLRNPWGHNGAVVNGLAGSWNAYDQSFWRSVPLNEGGVFAIPASTFKTYFWQFGWVS
ncbi:C2 family cysteine protease [Myxococcota bacterium]|nr:C2 family cysteine protease [Myxococcota bacterium]